MKVRICDLFTLMNAVSGVLAIAFVLNDERVKAAIFMLVAVVFDFLDGKIARALNETSAFGRELDSLSDIISFGLAPAILAFTLYPNAWMLLCVTAFVLAGVMRLARFNVTHDTHYTGMPITINGLLFPVMVFFNAPVAAYAYACIVSAMLMVSTFKVKKP